MAVYRICNERLKHYKEKKFKAKAFTEFEGSLNSREDGPISTSICPHLGLSIITPATVSHSGAILVPVRLGVRMSGVGSIVVPALLTPSCFSVIPAGLGVALGVAFIIIPATSALLWVLVFIMLGLLLCSILFSLQEVRRSGALWRVWNQEEVSVEGWEKDVDAKGGVESVQ